MHGSTRSGKRQGKKGDEGGRTRWRGADHAWNIKGVNYDAAFRDIVRGIILLASGRGAPD